MKATHSGCLSTLLPLGPSLDSLLPLDSLVLLHLPLGVPVVPGVPALDPHVHCFVVLVGLAGELR